MRTLRLHIHIIYIRRTRAWDDTKLAFSLLRTCRNGGCYTCAEQKSRRFNAMSLLVELQTGFGQDASVSLDMPMAEWAKGLQLVAVQYGDALAFYAYRPLFCQFRHGSEQRELLYAETFCNLLPRLVELNYVGTLFT